MIDLMQQGGVFMYPLAALAVAVVVLAARKALDLFTGPDQPLPVLKRGLGAIVQVGLFSFFLGLLAQAIGIMEALQAIQRAGDVSPALIMGGIRVSMIAPVFGLLIFLGSAVLWFILHTRYEQLAARR